MKHLLILISIFSSLWSLGLNNIDLTFPNKENRKLSKPKNENALNTALEGKVKDKATGEPIIFTPVSLYKNDILFSNVETDLDGNYFFGDISPGTYNVVVSYIGYKDAKIVNVLCKAGQTTRLPIDMEVSTEVLTEVLVTAYKVPLIEIDNTSKGAIITSDKIDIYSSKKSIDDIPISSIVSKGKDGKLRGSRSDETVYFIDGIRTEISDKEKNRRKEEKEKEDIHNKITAGEWNDLHHWDKWQTLIKDKKFESMNKYWNINNTTRYSVFVHNKNNQPISGIKLWLSMNEDTIWTSISDTNGKGELWANIENLNKKEIKLNYEYQGQKLTMRKALSITDGINNIKVNETCQPINKAEICFVVDATGSMSDEIDYLKSDLSNVISTINENHKEVNISLSSVFYRDINDEYLTKESGFTEDINETISFIKKQNAGGGGDTPEAVEVGLEKALNLNWSKDRNIVKVIFLLLDAPPHHNEESINKYNKYVASSAQRGIKIIPITASGIDRNTEFLMKYTSMLTNGTYVFITEHSGIGSGHLAPVHNDFEVEKLNDLLVRLISGYIRNPCNQDVTLENSEILVSPNPAANYANLSFKNKPKSISILSTSGQKMMQVNVEESPIKLDFGNLLTGIYFIKLDYEDREYTKKIVIINK